MSRTHRRLLREVNVKRRRARLLRRHARFVRVVNLWLSYRRWWRGLVTSPSWFDRLLPARRVG